MHRGAISLPHGGLVGRAMFAILSERMPFRGAKGDNVAASENATQKAGRSLKLVANAKNEPYGPTTTVVSWAVIGCLAACVVTWT